MNQPSKFLHGPSSHETDLKHQLPVDVSDDMEAGDIDESTLNEYNPESRTQTRVSNRKLEDFLKRTANLIDLTPAGAARFRKYSLDGASLDLSDEPIAQSRKSEVFRGKIRGLSVAVKRLRIDVTSHESNEELKSLLNEIDVMCRFSTCSHSASTVKKNTELHALGSQESGTSVHRGISWSRCGH
jgi:hypothetical protein